MMLLYEYNKDPYSATPFTISFSPIVKTGVDAGAKLDIAPHGWRRAIDKCANLIIDIGFEIVI